jgi:hypothetical protein
MLNKTGGNKTLRSIRSIFLAAVFIYLVSMMIVLGNGSSFLGRKLGFIYTPVANSIGLNTTWNFFSPDPAHTMYLKYRILFKDEYGNEKKEAIEKFFPADAEDNNFWPNHRRLTYVMRFLAIDSNRIQNFLVPWICKQNPEATDIQTEMLLYRIPALDVVSTLKQENYNEMLNQEQINQMTYACVK